MNVQIVRAGEQIVLQGRFFIFANRSVCQLDFARASQPLISVNDSCYHVISNVGEDAQAQINFSSDVSAVRQQVKYLSTQDQGVYVLYEVGNVKIIPDSAQIVHDLDITSRCVAGKQRVALVGV